MADISSYTHKWRATGNQDHRLDANKVHKRNRQPVSCLPCRTRKLKCDRGHPCDGCLKRGEASSCVYGKTMIPATNAPTTRKDDALLSIKAQDRLKHLEDLVRSMVESPARAHPKPPKETSSLDCIVQTPVAESAVDKNIMTGASYSGSTHWTAILQHISELRTDIGTHDTSYEPVPEAIDYSKPDALFGGYRPHSLEQILKTHLPPRIQVDRRVTQYFNAQYMIIPFLHAGQFHRQYEKFWTDPLNTNVIWISKMFSLCCLAATLNMAKSSASSYRAEVARQRDSFEAAAGECLVLGNYSKPQPHVIEAISLFLQCKYSRSVDPQSEIALTFGIQIRLAYMMGYHRDGSNFPGQITPFETEMRRRVWAMLRQFDLMVAFQLGIPSSVAPDSWDTKRPNNLLDTDFDEDTKVLPPSRSEDQVTQILYFVVKSRVIDVYSKVCHHALSFPAKPVTSSEIMELDKLCRQAADKIPAGLKARPISSSITSPAAEIITRINLSFLWRKSLCVLHRKYMVYEGNDYSHRTCIEAGLAMCETFIDAYPEFQPGGTFENDGWMLSSFTIIDFLLVSMILCLALSVSRKKFLKNGGDLSTWLWLPETMHILSVLNKCRDLCIEIGAKSREAKRVSGVISSVLEKLSRKTATKSAKKITPFSITQVKIDPQEGILEQNPTPLEVQNRDGISLIPLSLSETAYSTNASSGIFPPLHADSKELHRTDYSPQNVRHSIQDPVTQPSEYPNTILRPFFPGAQRHTFIATAPTNFNMDVDEEFLSNFMEDPGSFSNIDWTQLDQFTGVFGSDAGLQMDLPNVQTSVSNPTTSDGQSTDVESWDSVPMYTLGARTFDPLTGARQSA